GAVPAHAPPLVLGPPIPFGLLQELLRQARRDRLGRVEHREVPPQDLLVLVALDAAGSAVPGGHPPARIEDEDGVVGDALHQAAELLLLIFHGSETTRS